MAGASVHLSPRQMPPVFDGHNDVLLRLARKAEPDGGVASFLTGDGAGHIDLPRAVSGGFAGGLFAVFVPSDEPEGAREELMRQTDHALPHPPPPDLSHSQRFAIELISLLLRICRASNGAVQVCRSAGEIRDCMKSRSLAAIV